MENAKLALLKNFIGIEILQHPSPVGKWLKGILLSAERGQIVMEFLVREEMCNAGGILQGGMLTTIIDEAMGMAVFSLGNENRFTSVNLNVDFLYPIKPGEKITATSDVIKEGKNIVYVGCTIRNSVGKMAAQSYSNLLLLT